MLISVKDIRTLSPEDSGKVDMAEKYVNEIISKAIENDPINTAPSFKINTGELSKAIGGLTLRVRAEIVHRAKSAGFRITEDVANSVIVLAVPRRGGPGRKPKSATVTVPTGETSQVGVVVANTAAVV